MMKVDARAASVEALLIPRSESAPKGGGGFPDTLREVDEAHQSRESREVRSADDENSTVERDERSERADSSERDDDATGSEPSESTDDSVSGDEVTGEPAAGESAGSAWNDALGQILPLVSSVSSTNPVSPGLTESVEAVSTTPISGAVIDPTAVGSEVPTVAQGLRAEGQNATIPGNEGVVDLAGQGPVNRDQNPAVPAGAPVAEGETVQSLSRGTDLNQTGPVTELAAKSGPVAAESSWFQKASTESTLGEGRAAFHLLDRNAASNAVTPVEAPNPQVPANAKPESAPAMTFRVDGGTAEATTTSSLSGPNATPGETMRASGTPRAAEVLITEAQNPGVLAKKVFRQVRSSLGRGEHELTLRLDPPRLGRIEVDMAVDSERVGLRFVVETEEVRDALRSSIDELHRALEEQGLRADQVDVDLRESGGEQEFSSFGARTGDGSAKPENPDEKPVEDHELRLWHLGKTVDLRG